MAKKAAAAAPVEMPDIPGLGSVDDPRIGPGAGGPAPGAILWKPQPMPTTIPTGGRRVRFVSGQYSVLGPYDGAYAGAGAIRAEMEDKGTTPIPPPVPPTLTAFTALPQSVEAGKPLTLAVTLSAPAPAPLSVGVQTPWLSAQIPVPQGASAATSQLVVPLGASAGTAAIRATLGASVQLAAVTVTAPAPEPPIPIPPIPIPPTPTPGPFPPVTRTIDMTGKSQADIQKALNAAQPGDGIYLGPGLYSLPATMGGDGQSLDLVQKRGVTLFGAGEATVLDCLGKEGVWSRQGGNVNEGNCIRDLAIRNSRRAIAALDPQRLWISRVSMTNVSHGYASERTSAFDNMMAEWKVSLLDCVVRSWASHGAMLHGGETVERCQFIDTPGNSGSSYSHGLYMQGCKNLTVRDVEIANVSGHAWQLYSDSSSHEANGALNVLMERITCRNCMMGGIIAANGDYDRITINDHTTVGTISRQSPTMVISATNSPILNLSMKNLVIDGGGEGLCLQGGQTGEIRNMEINGLTIRNHSVGVVVGPSSWPYTKIVNSRILSYSAPGVSLPVRGTSPGLTIS